MKYLLCTICVLICGLGYAESIGNVEYQLPKSAENWVVGNKLANDKGTTIIYIPNGVERQDADEFFGVNANIYTIDLNDAGAIKEGLTKLLPQSEIEFQVIEKNKDAIIYEWTAKENGMTYIYGLGKAFSTKDGTVVLNYQNGSVKDISKLRSTWLPALQSAQSK